MKILLRFHVAEPALGPRFVGFATSQAQGIYPIQAHPAGHESIGANQLSHVGHGPIKAGLNNSLLLIRVYNEPEIQIHYHFINPRSAGPAHGIRWDRMWHSLM